MQYTVRLEVAPPLPMFNSREERWHDWSARPGVIAESRFEVTRGGFP